MSTTTNEDAPRSDPKHKQLVIMIAGLVNIRVNIYEYKAAETIDGGWCPVESKEMPGIHDLVHETEAKVKAIEKAAVKNVAAAGTGDASNAGESAITSVGSDHQVDATTGALQYFQRVLKKVYQLVEKHGYKDSVLVYLSLSTSAHYLLGPESTIYNIISTAMRESLNNFKPTGEPKLIAPGDEGYWSTPAGPILHKCLGKPWRYAVILVVNSVGARIFVYQWSAWPGDNVSPDDINLPEKWEVEGSRRDFGIHQLVPEAGDMAKMTAQQLDTETAERVNWYFEPLFKYIRHCLKRQGFSNGTIPLLMAATAGIKRLQQEQPNAYKLLCTAINKYVNGIKPFGADKLMMEECTVSGEEFSWGVASGQQSVEPLYLATILTKFNTKERVKKEFVAVIMAAGPSKTSLYVYEWTTDSSTRKLSIIQIKDLHKEIALKDSADHPSNLQEMFKEAVTHVDSAPVLLLVRPGTPDLGLEAQSELYDKVASCADDDTRKKLTMRGCITIPGQGEITEEDRLDTIHRFVTMSTQYAILLDAGSSGTRIFVYKWKGCRGRDEKPILPDEIHLPYGWDSDKSKAESSGIHELAPKTAAGIAAAVIEKVGAANINAGTAAEIAIEISKAPKTATEVVKETTKKVKEYLDPLFKYARGFLPKDTKSIPVFLLATAGVRRLKETNYEGYEILWEVIEKYLDASDFKKEECEMISGDDEGLYGWVAANYSAGTFINGITPPPAPRGFVETGGESAQIAFCAEPGDCKDYQGQLTLLEISGRQFRLFTRTWLGLGANAIWKRHEKKMLEDDGVIVNDPCLPKEYSYKVGDKITVGKGDFQESVDAILSFIRCKGGCTDDEDETCSDGGNGNGCLIKDAPSLGFKARIRQFLGASVYWHATHGVFGAGKSESEQESYNLETFSQEVDKFSGMTWTQIKAKYPNQNPKFLWNSFFNAVLIMVTLHYGFGIPMEGESTISDPKSPGLFKTIDATWTLGRIILHAIKAKPEVQSRRRWGTDPEVN